MGTNPTDKHSSRPRIALPRVMVATTAMLTYISFWRAAAVVLNDLGSSAFYAGGIAEQAVGPSAPWFILAVMLFAYAVAQMYVESCSMFVRGGVYRVVKEAMGGNLAKISVSALLFDYILTGPISGVSAGQYLVAFLNELFRYAHMQMVLPANSGAAIFASMVTLYFWWQNVKGIEESSDKAVVIMQFTTVMVVLMIGWCGYTLWVRGGHLPPLPIPKNLHFSPDAEGWLLKSRLPEIVGVIGIMVAFGHSVLAMSGLETLAQVYREIEHPKLPNLKKTAFVVFIYSMLFTSLVSFFAFMIIPNAHTRLGYKDNLIAGLAMNVVGPFFLRLLFHGFVVVVGIMMLSGAINTAIVGANGVLNRLSEDRVLADWFRRPHPKYGTSYRLVNLVAALQILTILLSRGNVILLGEAYAFGVIWSFAMKGMGVLVLRYRQGALRGFEVPLNFKIGKLEIPAGLGLITLTLFATASINLLTKEIATMTGVAFTFIFFVVLTISERASHRRGGEGADLDQFNLEPSEEITPDSCGCRPDSILVLLPDYHKLYHLARVLERVSTERRDVVALHIRVLMRAGSGEHPLSPEQLFTVNEQELFTRTLAISEKYGKPVKLAVVAANDVWDGMVRAAQTLQASTMVLGLSSKMALTEEARRVGLAWERLPEPKPRLSLEIHTPGGQEEIFYLGPHAPRLTANEIDLLHHLWLEFSGKLGEEELHHHDIIHFALNEVRREIEEDQEHDVVERLKRHLDEIRSRRIPHL